MSDWPWNSDLLPPPLLPLATTFEGFLALQWEELTPQTATVRFVVRDDLRQPLGLLHGGIYSAVAETVASLATAAVALREGRTVSGLSNAAQFLRPVTSGTVSVYARCRHRDEGEWLWSHDFRDDADRLCALVDVWIAVRPSRP